jgi:hypothetical protein
MSLAEYFEKTMGIGVLATADDKGKVDAAIYARPHVQDETNIAFIMSDKLSHKNLQTNPSAVYLFVEKKEGYVGKRLYLTKVREETSPAAIEAISRRQRSDCRIEGESYLVYFKVDAVRPLIGNNI